MDNAGKWWDTQDEAEALRKFNQVESQQRPPNVQRWKVAVIAAGLFLSAVFGFLVGRGGWQ